MTDLKKAKMSGYRTRTKRLDYINKESIFNVPNLLTLFFILCDFVVLYSKWTTVQNENWEMVLLIAAGCAVVLDLPMMQAAKEVVKYRLGISKSKRNTVFIVTASIIAFLVVFAFSVWFGYETRTFSFTEQSIGGIVNNIGGGAEQIASQSDSNTVLAASAFSSILPFCTSISSFVLTLVTYTPDKERRKRVEKAKAWAEDNLAHVRQAISETSVFANGSATMIALEKDRYNQFVESVYTQGLLRKQAFRDALAEKCVEDYDMLNVIGSAETVNEATSFSDLPYAEFADELLQANPTVSLPFSAQADGSDNGFSGTVTINSVDDTWN